MKNSLLKFFSFLFISLLVLFSCKSDKDDPIPAPPEPEKDIMVAENTKIINSEVTKDAQISFNEATEVITVKNPDALDKPIEKGDILISGENGGYLLKVTTMEKKGGEVVAQTTQATFEEAFQNLELSLDIPIEQKSEEAEKRGIAEYVYYEAKPVEGSMSKFSVSANDRLVTKAGGSKKLLSRKFSLALDKDSIVYAKGKVELSPKLIGEVNIRRFKLKKVDLGFEIAESLSLEYYAKKEWNTDDKIKDKKLKRFAYKDIIVMAGGVPIAIRPELDFYVGFKASVEGKVSMKAKQEYSYTVGLRYTGSAWESYKEESFNASLEYPEITAEAEAKVYIKPVMSLRFYRVVAPQIKVETGIKAKVEASAEPINGFNFDWGVDAYLDAFMGVDVSVLGKSLANYETANPILALDYNILSAKDFNGNRPPNVPTLGMPENNFSGNIVDKFTWECSDPNGDALVYDFYLGKKDSNGEIKFEKRATDLKKAEYQLNQSLSYGTYYWKVVAKEVKTEKIKEPKQAESIVYSFTLVEPNKAPTKPQLLSPANNATVNDLTALSWKASTDADGDDIKYTIYLSAPNGDELAPIETDYTKTTYEFNQSKAAGKYKWQVVATDGKANTESEIFSFTLKYVDNLEVDKTSVAMEVGKTATVNITAGSGNYTVSSNNNNVATASLQGNIITIRGIAEGTTNIVVTDTESNQQKTVAVTVTEPNTPTPNRPKLALEYVAEYNLAPNGTDFATTHEYMNDEQGYFTFEQAREKAAAISGYHLPTKTEWVGIFRKGYDGNEYIDFKYSRSFNDVSETITINGNTQTYQADYRSLGNGTVYAVKMKGHGDINRTAYRYRILGISGGNDFRMVVDAIYLGDDISKSINNIEDLNWNKPDATREFWAAGKIHHSRSYRGTEGDFWSATAGIKSYRLSVVFYSDRAFVGGNFWDSRCSVRLFR